MARGKITLTVEYKDKPSKQLDVYPEEAVSLLRDLAFRIASSHEYVGVYMTRGDVLRYIKEGGK